MRWRPLLSLGVIAALGVAVWAALSAGRDEPSPTTSTAVTVTTASSTSTTTTTTTVPTTSPTEPPPTTAVPDSITDPEARLEEVRLILEDLWFRWFDAIYRENEEAVRTVAATPAQLEAFWRAVEASDWTVGPSRSDVVVRDLELLLDSETCLVTYATVDLTSWLGSEAITTGVDVLYDHATGWRFATHWVSKSDLWEADCSADRTDNLP